jgi:GNAT superfamily N-acetyltransferase
MIELPPPNRHVLEPMFADYPYLRGYVPAVLAGGMGRAFVDDADDPKRGGLHLLWVYLFAGDPTGDDAAEMIRRIPAGSALVGPNAEWEQMIQETLGDDLDTSQRVAFGPGSWNRKRLETISRDLPPGYAMKQVTESEVEQFAQLIDWLIAAYPSRDAFLEDGVGFAVDVGGKIVSGCSAFAMGGGKIDFGVATLTDYRGRGLAAAVSASMILYCLENNIEPCWDAMNDTATRLGTRLGFTNPTPYITYSRQPRKTRGGLPVS